MTKPERFTPINAAKRFARYGAYIGLASGILYSFGGAIYDAQAGQIGGGTALAFLALIGMPVIGALAGAALGALSAVIWSALLWHSQARNGRS